MAFPTTYEEAKASFKPLKRSRLTQSSFPDGKTSSARRIVRKAALSKKAKRPKRLTDGKLKKLVWKQFSIFIRTRGADENGFNKCVTCGITKFWRDLHAGHFLRGRLNANLFDERGTQPQCYACNVGRDGNVVEYYEWMLEHHGPEVIAELKQQNNQTRKWRPGELKALLNRYRALNAENPLVEKG